jgi:C1A family cysteine protease
VGQFTAITIGPDGRGLVSYYDATNGDLRVAHCADVDCQSTTHTVVQNQNNVGQFTTIAMGIDGRGLISYYDATNGDLKVAHCSNSFCVPYHRR